MNKIKYKLKLELTEYISSIEKKPSFNKLNNQFKNTIPIALLKQENNINELSNGWLNESDLFQPFIENNNLYLTNSNYIKDKKNIITKLDGPVITISNQKVFNDDKINRILNNDQPVLTSETLGHKSLTFCGFFERKNNKVSIYKQYQYIELELIESKLKNYQYTEVFSENNYYVILNRNYPIAVSYIFDCKLEFDFNDYLSSSFNYNYIPNKYNLSLDNFLRMCDYYKIDKKMTDETIYKNFGIWINTSYFPIYKHITIIAHYVNENTNEKQLIQISEDVIINTINGTIFIKNIDLLNNNYRLEGFYLFYGIIPALYLNKKDKYKISLSDLLSYNEDYLSYIKINDKYKDDNLYISKHILNINLKTSSEIDSTVLYLNNENQNIFLEPDDNIIINGVMIKKNEKYWIKNNFINKLYFESPINFIELLNQISVLNNGEIIIDNNDSILSNNIAIYGLFKYQDFNRLTLCSIANNLNINFNILDKKVAQGYGEGEYGLGGFGEGELKTYNTTVYYTIPNNNNNIPIVNNKISINVKPVNTGYEIILPAWTDSESIIIKNIETDKIFTKWYFINPDIIILDKDYIKDNSLYNITFDFIIHPIIESINLLTNKIKINILKNPYSLYNNFKQYFILKNKNIRIKIGYLDQDTKYLNYYNQYIDLNIIINNEYIKRIITGTKTLIF